MMGMYTPVTLPATFTSCLGVRVWGLGFCNLFDLLPNCGCVHWLQEMIFVFLGGEEGGLVRARGGEGGGLPAEGGGGGGGVERPSVVVGEDVCTGLLVAARGREGMRGFRVVI